MKYSGDNDGIYLVDCLPHHYLIIEDSEFKYIKIKYDESI